MKTKENILRAKTASEVLKWMKENAELVDNEISAYFNQLSRKELEARIGEDFADMHYDFSKKHT